MYVSHYTLPIHKFNKFFLIVPPYGSDKDNVNSLFDLCYLKESLVLLDIQCKSRIYFLIMISYYFFNFPDRMPPVIGTFLSQHIYNSELHNGSGRQEDDSIYFVDVQSGKEYFNCNEKSYLVML